MAYDRLAPFIFYKTYHVGAALDWMADWTPQIDLLG